MQKVTHGHTGGSDRAAAALAPGELVWARIINGLENPGATGKFRPVILIEARGSQWHTMGLTTNPCYRDGSPRVGIPDPEAVGLERPGWLWGERLAWSATLDITDHIGWVEEALALEVIELAGLRGTVVGDLLGACDEHHPAPGSGPRLDHGGPA
jgi:hypothetical protein